MKIHLEYLSSMRWYKQGPYLCRDHGLDNSRRFEGLKSLAGTVAESDQVSNEAAGQSIERRSDVAPSLLL